MKNKKAIIIIIAIIFIIFFGIIRHFQISKYGYLLDVEKFGNPGMQEQNVDVVVLNNKDLLKIGMNFEIDMSAFRNFYNNDYSPYPDFIKRVNYRNFEILDYKTKETKEIDFQEKIYFWNSGILIDNNKLLLTHVGTKRIKKSILYDSLAIVDLNSMKIEKTIKRKPVVLTKSPLQNAKLNNKVFILDEENKRVEIFDIKSHKLKTIDLSKFALEAVQLFSNDKDRIFIIIMSLKNKIEPEGIILEYNFKTQTFEKLEKVLGKEIYAQIKTNGDTTALFFGAKNNKAVFEVYFGQKPKKIIVINCRNKHGTASFEFLNDKEILIVEGFTYADMSWGPAPLIYEFNTNFKNNFYKNIYILNLETEKFHKIGRIPTFLEKTKIIKIKNNEFYIYGTQPKLLKLWRSGINEK